MPHQIQYTIWSESQILSRVHHWQALNTIQQKRQAFHHTDNLHLMGPIISLNPPPLLHGISFTKCCTLFFFFLGPTQQSTTCGLLKHLTNTLVGLCRTLQVFLGLDGLPHVVSLLLRHWLLWSFASSATVFWSCLRSFLHPTRMTGRYGQKWTTSEIHFSCTLSSESGESMAKQIRMTCESGYERGRRLS